MSNLNTNSSSTHPFFFPIVAQHVVFDRKADLIYQMMVVPFTGIYDMKSKILAPHNTKDLELGNILTKQLATTFAPRLRN